jgi:hypothetical protein
MKETPGVSAHARARMSTRYGVHPRRSEWLAAVAAILDRTALLMGVNHNTGRERWRLSVAGIEVEVWWEPGCAQIVTVMPPGAKTAQDVKRTNNAFRSRAYTRERHRPHYDAEDWR